MVGSQLTLLGRNFLVPSDQNTVSMGSVSINQFLPFSNESTLSFTVPNLFASLPADVPVTVSNRNGTSTPPLTVHVTPLIVIPKGEVSVTNTTPDLGVIQTVDQHPQGYDFTFSVNPHTTVPETFDFSVVYANVAASSLAAWLAATSINPSGPQLIPIGSPLTVTVHVAVPTGATSADMALHVRSQHNDAELSMTSGPVKLVVGQQGEVSHPGVDFRLDPIFNPAPGDTARAAKIGGLDGYEVRFGTSGTIPVTVLFTNPATAAIYRFVVDLEPPGGVWSTSVLPTSGQETIPGMEPLAIKLTCSATGPDPAQRSLVVRAFKRDTTNTNDEWSAFRRFPIRGYSS
jgi:hypothetical protein